MHKKELYSRTGLIRKTALNIQR